LDGGVRATDLIGACHFHQNQPIMGQSLTIVLGTAPATTGSVEWKSAILVLRLI
jgi:hypothetical protein